MPTKHMKKCERKGCRKKAKPGSGLCEVHDREVQEAAQPLDGVVRISELRAYKFAALDAEIRNHVLAARNIELEMEQARAQYEAAQKQRTAQRQAYTVQAATKKKEYDQLVKTIADELGLDPTQMTIDPETQIVRDLRKD